MNDNISSERISSWEDAVLWLKSQPEKQDLIEACFYDDPLLVAADRYYQSTEWKALSSYLPKPGRVLDIGAGRGISSYAFARDGWEVDSLEPDDSDVVGAGAIRLLAESAKLNITVEQTWGEKLPYGDEAFDVVFGRQVLHHAHNLATLCKEAARVLKPNGMYIFIREHVITKAEDLPLFLEQHPLHHLYGGEHAYMLEEYLEAIRNSGVTIIDVLNPLESNINLYPENKFTYKQQLAKKVKLPASLIPDLFLSIYGARINAPGRLYSFIGQKHV